MQGVHDVFPDQIYEEFIEKCTSNVNWKTNYSREHIKVSHRQAESTNIHEFRASIILKGVKENDVFNFLNDKEYRPIWDKNGLENFSFAKSGENITFDYFSIKTPPIIKNRDVILIRSCSEKNGWQLIINKSVQHKDYPPKPSFVRALSILSGYCFKEDKEKQLTNLIAFTHMDPKESLVKYEKWCSEQSLSPEERLTLTISKVPEINWAHVTKHDKI